MSVEIAKSITRNTAILMGSQIVTWASSLILMLFLPRYLGNVEYGRLYLAMSLMFIFSMIIDFGGRFSITKEVSRNREMTAGIIADSSGVRVIFWGISLAILIPFSFIAGYPPVTRLLIIILGIGMLWEGIRNLLLSCYQGSEDMKYPSLGGIAERVFVTLFGVGALLLGANSVIIAVFMTIGMFLNLAICVWKAPWITSLRPSFNRKNAFDLLRTGLPYFLWSIFGVIYYRIAAVMLSLMTPETVVGWYGAAQRFFDILMFLPSLFSLAVFPVLSRLWKEEQSLALTTRKSLEFIMLAGIPVSISTYGFADRIIQLFFGVQQYAPTIVILQILAVGLLLVYIDIILGTAIIASDKQREWSIVAFVAILLTTGLNYFLIPYSQTKLGNGGIGASISTIITEFFVMTMALRLIPKRMFEGSKVTVPLKGIAAGALMYLSMMLLRLPFLPWIVQAIVSLGIYVVVLFALKTFNPEEIAFMRQSVTLRNLRRAFVPERSLQS